MSRLLCHVCALVLCARSTCPFVSAGRVVLMSSIIFSILSAFCCCSWDLTICVDCSELLICGVCLMIDLKWLSVISFDASSWNDESLSGEGIPRSPNLGGRVNRSDSGFLNGIENSGKNFLAQKQIKRTYVSLETINSPHVIGKFRLLCFCESYIGCQGLRFGNVNKIFLFTHPFIHHVLSVFIFVLRWTYHCTKMPLSIFCYLYCCSKDLLCLLHLFRVFDNQPCQMHHPFT